jgi:hypothetical protein
VLTDLVYLPTAAAVIFYLCVLAWVGLGLLFLGLALFQALSWPRFFLIVGAALLVGAVRALAYFLIEAKIDACAEGLVFRSNLGAATPLPYDEIEEIATAPPGLLSSGDSLQGATLVGSDGFRLALGTVEEQSLETLKLVLLERVARPIGERLLRRLREGKSVALADVEVSPRGLRAEGERLDWNEIDYATFRKDGLRVVARDPDTPPLVLPYGTPNLHALLHVLREMRQGAEEAEQAGGEDLYAFLPEALRPGTAGDRPARRKPPRLPGYAAHDPELGDLQLGSPRKSAVLIGVLLALVVTGAVVPAVILLGVFPPPVWIPTVVVSFILILNAIDPSKRGLAVYEKGVVQGRKRVPWRECARVSLLVRDVYLAGTGSAPRRDNRMQIESYRALVFLELIGEQGRELCYRVLDATLPPLVRRYHDLLVTWGGSLTVKGVTLTRDALLCNDKEYPLERLRRPKVSDGRMVCESRGASRDTIELDASEWNFPVLYALFTRLWVNARRKGADEP